MHTFRSSPYVIHVMTLFSMKGIEVYFGINLVQTERHMWRKCITMWCNLLLILLFHKFKCITIIIIFRKGVSVAICESDPHIHLLNMNIGIHNRIDDSLSHSLNLKWMNRLTIIVLMPYAWEVLRMNED